MLKCTRCRNVITPEESKKLILMNYTDGKYKRKQGSEIEEFCFCEYCVMDITQYAEQRPPAKPRTPVDHAKIWALKQAGWDNKRIADEMGMTYAAVGTSLAKTRKKIREERNGN